MTPDDFAAVVALTQQLVRRPSEPRHEGAVRDFLLEDAAARGFDSVRADEHGSVVMTVAGAQPGPTPLLDAHTDTVDVAWSHEPFGGEIIGGRLYGRGAADMKGALAAMIVAFYYR